MTLSLHELMTFCSRLRAAARAAKVQSSLSQPMPHPEQGKEYTEIEIKTLMPREQEVGICSKVIPLKQSQQNLCNLDFFVVPQASTSGARGEQGEPPLLRGMLRNTELSPPQYCFVFSYTVRVCLLGDKETYFISYTVVFQAMN